ncbi:MAG: hypothetical protein EBY91_07635 [Burkholderiaceae bacterium]|nr:hypothetical protein [Burkholderiaceae bacterium]
MYSSSNNPYLNFKFHECFPVSLSAFVMNTQEEIMQAITDYQQNRLTTP